MAVRTRSGSAVQTKAFGAVVVLDDGAVDGLHVVEQGVRVTMRYPSALVAPLSYSALNPGSRAGMERAVRPFPSTSIGRSGLPQQAFRIS